jgi:hypothetical protein
MLPLVGVLPQASSLLRSREMSHGSQVGHLCLVPVTACILKVDEALLSLLMPLGSSLDVAFSVPWICLFWSSSPPMRVLRTSSVT